MGLADVPFTIQIRNRPCHFQHPLASARGQAELLGDKGWKGMGDWLGTATSSAHVIAPMVVYTNRCIILHANITYRYCRDQRRRVSGDLELPSPIQCSNESAGRKRMPTGGLRAAGDLPAQLSLARTESSNRALTTGAKATRTKMTRTHAHLWSPQHRLRHQRQRPRRSNTFFSAVTRSLMMPSAPRSSRCSISAPSSTVQTCTGMPRAWAARRNAASTTGIDKPPKSA